LGDVAGAAPAAAMTEHPSAGSRARWAAIGAAAALCLLALALRLYRLDGQSLWNDEGTSVALAGRSLAAITRDASHDIHPPFYYYLLHLWVSLWGNSAIAVRALSALLGALVVPVVYALGQRLFGPREAAAAALCAALSPLGVYYSQEVRMYILVTLLGAMSFWLFARWTDAMFAPRPRARGLLAAAAYVLVTVLMMYSHYFAFTLVVAQNAAFVLRWLADARAPRSQMDGMHPWRAWPALRPWIIAQVAVLVAFAPWLTVVWRQLRYWPAVSEPFGLRELLARVAYAFNVGLSLEEVPWALAGFGVILALGWAAAAWQLTKTREPSQAWNAAVAWLYALMPVALMYLLSRQRPMYNAKFLLLATPGYALLLGRALVQPWRGTAGKLLAAAWLIAGVLFISAISGWSLRNYYHDPRYARDDYRGIARYIEAVGAPNDAILINAPGQYETFVYYYQGELPIWPLPKQRPIDTAQTEADLREMARGRQHIYAILWATDESDPARFIEGWLDQQAYKATDNWYGNVRLVTYALPQSSAAAAPQPVDAQFGPITLRDYALLTPEVPSGDILQLALRWETHSPLDRRYKVFIHVLDEADHIVGQRDAEPGGGVRLTTTWQSGESIADNHGVLILPATPPGTYRIALGLYDIDSGQRLPVQAAGQAAGDRLILSPLTVTAPAAPPPLSALGLQRQLDWQAGPLALLGDNLTRLGHEHEPGLPIRAGDVLHLVLFWQAQGPSPDVELLLELVDRAGQVRLARRAPPLDGRLPVSQWGEGQIMRDPHLLFLPGDLAPGAYTLRLGVYDASGGALLAPRALLKVIIE